MIIDTIAVAFLNLLVTISTHTKKLQYKNLILGKMYVYKISNIWSYLYEK